MASILPFMENANTIIQFANYCGIVFNFLMRKSDDKPDLKTSDYKDFSNMVNPIIADNKAKIHIGTVINGDVNVIVSSNNIEANAIQNVARMEVEELKKTEITEQIHEKVLMSWYQACSDTNDKAKNKGVIDALSEKPLKILFEDDDIKSKILYSDLNPLTSVFEVDVRIETAQGKPVAYRVVKLHELFDMDN